MRAKKGYLLVTALMLLAAVAIFVAVITNFVSNTNLARITKEKLFMASNASVNGVQLGVSYLAHFANSIGGFDINFKGVGAVPFNDVPWLQSSSSNNYFTSMYSSIDGNAWKSAFSILATDANVLWLNKIPQVEDFFETLKASGVIKTIPDVVIIQTKIPHTDLVSKSKYFIVAHAVIGGMTAYSSGFAVANFLNRYVYFTDVEPSNIYFITGDLIDGPLRTNDIINIYGDPVFDGFVEAKGYNILRGSSPEFKSGYETLSQSDIAKMNMAKIAKSYSYEINSEVSLPASIEYFSKSGINYPLGIDLSKINWNVFGFSKYPVKSAYYHIYGYVWKKNGYYTPARLAYMFKKDLDDWLSDNGISYSVLPSQVREEFEDAYNAIDSIMPDVEVTFDPQNRTLKMYYNYNVNSAVENALNKIDILEEDDYWWWHVGYYGMPDFDNVTYILQNAVSNGNKWFPLFDLISPNKSPGKSYLVPSSETSTTILGLSSPATVIFNFNGVIKVSANMYISGNLNNATAYVAGKYTLYTTQNVFIQSDIVYSDADNLFSEENPRWLSTPVSTAMIKELRNSTCDDFLNIVANDNVTLTNNVPNNMKLMASIYAFTGSFSYADYNDVYAGPKGQLFLYGSLMQHERGPVGTFNRRGILSGFYKTYAFDWRILGGLPSNTYGTPSAQEKALLLSIRTVF